MGQPQSVYKLDRKLVDEFKFNSLISGNVDHDPGLIDIKDFEFQEINEYEHIDQEKFYQELSLERKCIEGSAFEVSPIVKKHRGLEEQEKQEYEQEIRDIVEERLEKLQKDAVEKGRQEGIQIGKEEVYAQARALTEEKLTALTSMINDVLKNQDDILNVQKNQIYKMIRNLVKWVILRELENDGEYLPRLLEKLIVELQTKDNLLIQVSKKDFDRMPEILDMVENNLGKLPNVRVEIDFDLEDSGLIVQSENGIINGTMDEQFRQLDKLFESVGIHEE